MTAFPVCSLTLPDWLADFLPPPERVYPTVEARMRLVIDLSRENVRRGTGGPFGAAIFDLATGRLLAPGVNRVVPVGSSIAHAEIMAIAVAQKLVGHYDLGGPGMPPYQLVASTEPCAMCFGATPWSGVRQLVCGARDEDARRVGFDEGPKVAAWQDALAERGITVICDVLRTEAAAVLQDYAAGGGPIYNARQGDPGEA